LLPSDDCRRRPVSAAIEHPVLDAIIETPTLQPDGSLRGPKGDDTPVGGKLAREQQLTLKAKRGRYWAVGAERKSLTNYLRCGRKITDSQPQV
jgi:hypothetical protein